MNSSKKKSVKKDLSSSSQREGGESENPVIERHTQKIPDGLRLRTRNIARDLESDQQPSKRVREMKKGLADGSKLESRSGSSSTISTTMSSYVNEYFNDDEEDLVIIDSDGEEKKRRRKKDEEVEHVTKFARSEKSELIELIYGSENKVDNSSSTFSYHNDNLQNDESDEEMDETRILNPILPGQNGPKVKRKKTPQKVSCVRILSIIGL